VGASDGNYRFSFTYVGGGSTTRADLLDLLSGAQHKIFVASFFIGDAQVREALCEAADRLRGGVYVISAMNERQFRNSVNEADEHETEDVDEATQRKRVRGADPTRRRGTGLRRLPREVRHR
jgi:hypothetical protein